MKELNDSNDFSSDKVKNAPDAAAFLNLYYQYLGDCSPLSAEEEALLWEKIEKLLQKIRKKLYAFGFVMQKHIQLLNEPETGNLEDNFHFPGDTDIPKLASAWKEEIELLYEKRRKEFISGSEYTGMEQESVQLLSRYPVRMARLRKWFHFAKICMNEPNPESLTFLSAKKAQSAVKDMEKDFADMDVIYQQIVTANLRLVVNLAKQFHRDGLQLQDLIQEGNLGLLQALERFDHTRGHRFATYATWWVRQGVLRSVSSQNRIIRLPSQMLNAIIKIRRAERQYIQKCGREPEIADLVSETGMSAERIRAIQRMAAQPISLLASVGNEDSHLTLEQVIPQEENDNSPEKSIASAMVKERLKKALKTLSERDRQILILHFGLGDVQQKNILEISRIFQLTPTRIRQIEAAALKKLRNPEITGTIDEYYD